MSTHNQAPAARNVAVAAAGFLSLIVAMGIGRFAFTPLLPLMQREGLIDIPAGAWLAAANYLGYFVGGISAVYVRLSSRWLVRLSLAGIALVTAAMGLAVLMQAWLLLRFGAGVLSAWAMVGASAWCLTELARGGRPDLAGLVYSGVGAGIAVAGGVCLAAGNVAPSFALWLILGALSAAIGLVAWGLIGFAGASAAPAAGNTPSAAPAQAPLPFGLVLAYGCFGFGYILPATFLPALARMVIDDPAVFGWAWPIFGATAALSTLLAGRLLGQVERVRLWAHGHVVMALGTAMPAVWPSGISIVLSAVCVGGTFMVVTMAGMQEARARAQKNPTAALGIMTTAFALGQIAGPVCSALLRHLPSVDDMAALRIALVIAAAALLASALWLFRSGARRAIQEGAVQ